MRWILQIIVLLLLLLLLAVTNPGAEVHQEAIGQKIGKKHGALGKIGGEMYSSLFTYKDYVFFSLTRFDGEIRSVGALGFVVPF